MGQIRSKKRPKVIPVLKSEEYGKNLNVFDNKINNKVEKTILIIKIFPKYLLAFDQSFVSSLAAIALIPKSTITKNSAGQDCIRLKAP